MSLLRNQKMAQIAFECVQRRVGDAFEEYSTFAKKFPALIHTCGLAQAVAFALAKQQNHYLEDLTSVLRAAEHTTIPDGASLDERARKSPMSIYLRLSRDALQAAHWLKRYVEASA